MDEALADRLNQTFDRLEELDARLAERAARRREDGTDLEEQHQQRLYERAEQKWQAAQPRPAPAVARVAAPPRDWAAERKWVERIVAGKLEAFAAGLGQEVAKIERDQLARLRREVEERIAKSDSATVELLLDLERRVAKLEKRAVPAKPRLVGGSNAA